MRYVIPKIPKAILSAIVVKFSDNLGKILDAAKAQRRVTTLNPALVEAHAKLAQLMLILGDRQAGIDLPACECAGAENRTRPPLSGDRPHGRGQDG